ncbi:phage tail protein [Anaerobacillus alkaliphilus]|uniref:phage tail protein n=1 Tax=Anaerobacillus alkaliphilus TaxID=1548597 RepID=UPI0019D55F63|nr:tail fiber protein [Anaerobacillus alkaliphilus]
MKKITSLLFASVIVFGILAGHLLAKYDSITPAHAAGNESYIGSVQLFAFNFEPIGWIRCEGQLLRIDQYPILFNLIGTKFGGDGVQTFRLPNMGNEYTPLASPLPSMYYYIKVDPGMFPIRN